jgi:hypothetical protein
MITKMSHLASPGVDFDDSLKPIYVRDAAADTNRVVFVPASLAPSENTVTVESIPCTATVLVPRQPEALDTGADEAMKRAFGVKDDLKSTLMFCSKRPFFAAAQLTLSVAHRKKQADIRQERLKMLTSLKSTSKGEIKSRDPPTASIKDRHPHYDATKNLCLANTCTWSEAFSENRSRDCDAVSRIGGQVKTEVDIMVLNKIAEDDPQLRNIINNMARLHCPDEQIPLLSTVPIVVQYLTAKVDLLVSNIIARQTQESRYNHWDLEITFAKDEWSVYLKGFLYSECFDDINKKIAQEGATLQELLGTISRNPESMPTVTLNFQRLSDHYGIQEDRAKVRENILKQEIRQG